MLYFTKEFSGIRSTVSVWLHRLATRLESESSVKEDNRDEITDQALRIYRQLEEVGRNENLPLYVITHYEENRVSTANVCQLVSKDRDIPGGRFIDLGQIIDVSDLDLTPERERDILALLNHRPPVGDPTGDVQHHIEAVDGLICSLNFGFYPERLRHPFVQMLRKIRAELYDSDSPGVILYCKREIDGEA